MAARRKDGITRNGKHRKPIKRSAARQPSAYGSAAFSRYAFFYGGRALSIVPESTPVSTMPCSVVIGEREPHPIDAAYAGCALAILQDAEALYKSSASSRSNQCKDACTDNRATLSGLINASLSTSETRDRFVFHGSDGSEEIAVYFASHDAGGQRNPDMLLRLVKWGLLPQATGGAARQQDVVAHIESTTIEPSVKQALANFYTLSQSYEEQCNKGQITYHVSPDDPKGANANAFLCTHLGAKSTDPRRHIFRELNWQWKRFASNPVVKAMLIVITTILVAIAVFIVLIFTLGIVRLDIITHNTQSDRLGPIKTDAASAAEEINERVDNAITACIEKQEPIFSIHMGDTWWLTFVKMDTATGQPHYIMFSHDCGRISHIEAENAQGREALNIENMQAMFAELPSINIMSSTCYDRSPPPKISEFINKNASYFATLSSAADDLARSTLCVDRSRIIEYKWGTTRKFSIGGMASAELTFIASDKQPSLASGHSHINSSTMLFCRSLTRGSAYNDTLPDVVHQVSGLRRDRPSRSCKDKADTIYAIQLTIDGATMSSVNMLDQYVSYIASCINRIESGQDHCRLDLVIQIGSDLCSNDRYSVSTSCIDTLRFCTNIIMGLNRALGGPMKNIALATRAHICLCRAITGPDQYTKEWHSIMIEAGELCALNGRRAPEEQVKTEKDLKNMFKEYCKDKSKSATARAMAIAKIIVALARHYEVNEATSKDSQAIIDEGKSHDEGDCSLISKEALDNACYTVVQCIDTVLNIPTVGAVTASDSYEKQRAYAAQMPAPEDMRRGTTRGVQLTLAQVNIEIQAKGAGPTTSGV